MSHFRFVFAITALVVIGTLVFTFLEGKHDNTPIVKADPPSRVIVKSPRSSSNGTSQNRHSSSNRYDLKIATSSLSNINNAKLDRINKIVRRISQDAYKELDDLTKTYALSSKQREKLFPYIVAHHKQAHPAMLVGDQSIPSISPDSSFDESLYSILDDEQKTILAENALDDDAWWKDVVGQLEADLDNAIEGGEMIAQPTEPSSPSGITEAEAPAAGDGEESSHSGGNLFDLLGQ